MHYPKLEMYPFFESIIQRTLCVRALRTAETSKRRCKPSASGDWKCGCEDKQGSVINDRAAGTGQTESRNFLADETSPARLQGCLFVFGLLWFCVHWNNPMGDNLLMIHLHKSYQPLKPFLWWGQFQLKM